MKDSETITTLTQERDALRLVLKSEIDARIRAESRALTADGLRVQLADARDRLDLCAAAVERLTQERDLAQERIVELLREAQWHRQEWQKMHDQMREQRVRAEKAETVRDEARDCLGRTVDQRVEAEADRDAAKTRITAALRCLAGKHYPAAIQALTIGTAQGCVVPPDPAMLKRLEEVTAERDHLRKEWDAHEAQIKRQTRVSAETILALTQERDEVREQHKALTAALGLAERARDGWRGRALEQKCAMAHFAPGKTWVLTGQHGRQCLGCRGCDEDVHAPADDACGGSGWVATASPEPARNAPQPDLTLEAVAHGGTEPAKGAWAPTSSQRDDLDTLDEGRPDPKGTEKAGHVGWLLHAHDATWQAKHQGPPAGCKGCAEQIEIPLTEMRRERDEWKARAKEAEDRAGYCARGRNKASADADKAQRERDEVRAEVALLRAGDERPADLIIKTRQSLDATLAEWRDKAIKAAPYVALVRDMAALDPIFDPDYLAKSKALVTRACALIEPAGDAPTPVAESAPRSPDPEPLTEMRRERDAAVMALAPLLALARDLAELHPPVAYNPWTTTARRLIAQARTLTGWRDATAEGSSVAVSTAPDRSDLQRAILLLASRPAPTHETIQCLCKWIGGIPLGETHRVLMDLCKAGRIVNRGLPDGYRLADEAAVRIEAPAPLGITRSITVTRRADDYLACITGQPGKWGCGSTEAAAVLDLRRTWPECAFVETITPAAPEQADPIPADVPTGQEDQHDADMRANEATTKETP